MRVSVIIVAAGQGKRMGAGVNKTYLHLKNKPVLIHTIEVFEAVDEIDEVIVVCAATEQEECNKLVADYGLSKVKKVVVGGQERQDSVYNGLQAASGEWVLVHDGARPFIQKNAIRGLLDKVFEMEAVILAVPVKDTIKMVDPDGIVTKTPDRKSLWAMQTPQAFRLSILREAYELARRQSFIGTDDASLVERLGKKVYITMGDYENIKLTTPDDLDVAMAILHKRGNE